MNNYFCICNIPSLTKGSPPPFLKMYKLKLKQIPKQLWIWLPSPPPFQTQAALFSQGLP